MPARTRAPITMPILRACPTCRVEIQPGKGPDGLAWHACRPPVDGAGVTPEAALQVVLRRIVDEAAHAGPRELAEFARVLLPRGGARGGGDTSGDGAELEAWLKQPPKEAT